MGRSGDILVKAEGAVPEEWTHKLVISFLKFPWAVEVVVRAVIEVTLIPTVNALEWFLGFDYVSYELDWAGSSMTLYYRQRGTPAIPLLALLKAIFLILLAVGLVIIALAWLQREVRLQQESWSLDQLLREGLITEEQWEALKKAEAEKPTWEKLLEAMPMILMMLLLVSVAGALPRPRRED